MRGMPASWWCSAPAGLSVSATPLTTAAGPEKSACRFTALQNLLPMRDKVEKAAMLTQAADYIRTLQVSPSHTKVSGHPVRVCKLWQVVQAQLAPL